MEIHDKETVKEVFLRLYEIMNISPEASNMIVDLVGYDNYLVILRWLNENCREELQLFKPNARA